ncbi:MAG TPA: hypothetical protein VI383_05240 [Gemmatimonadales bacterium]|nr:hypothetical protein [Gemmatimonadales bacterium]
MNRTLVAAALLTACSDFVSVAEYDQLPPLPQLDFSRVTPAGEFHLWELREASFAEPHLVIGRGGTADRNSLDPALVAAFDAAMPSFGFGEGCPPGDCFRYFISLEGNEIRIWSTAEAARAFLGTIDHLVEAALMASAEGYHWRDTRETSGGRITPDGFELVVLKIVSYCTPVQTDRFVLVVSAIGEIEIVRSQVWTKANEACI